MSSDRIKVIFVGGSSRSGSTLLDRMLGQIDGFFSLGEVRCIWDRGFIENELCGCGKPFKSCDFWQAVVREGFGKFNDTDAKHILDLERSVLRVRHLPWLALPVLRPPSYQRKLVEYVDTWHHLYKAISTVSGSEVLVDSSKTAPHGFLLNAIPDIDLYVAHLVRDSRAVAYSWQRKKLRFPAYERELMDRFNVSHTSREWVLQNCLVRVLGTVAPHYAVVWYEDLATRPEMVLHRLLERFELQTSQLKDLFADGGVELGENHMISGNPMRFDKGKIAIRSDNEWREQMLFRKRIAVTAITWPLLLYYGGKRKMSRLLNRRFSS